MTREDRSRGAWCVETGAPTPDLRLTGVDAGAVALLTYDVAVRN